MTKNSQDLIDQDMNIDTIFGQSLDFLLENGAVEKCTPKLFPFVTVKILHGRPEFVILLEFLIVKSCQFVLGEGGGEIAYVGVEVCAGDLLPGLRPVG